MKKPIVALLACGLIAGAALWFSFSRPSPGGGTADISGHWEGPQGGLWFDASATYFRIDIMHTFFYGRWKPIDASRCDLQFFDLTGDKPAIDQADMRGTAIVDRTGPKFTVLITMPDGSTGKFAYLHPPDGELADVERNLRAIEPK